MSATRSYSTVTHLAGDTAHRVMSARPVRIINHKAVPQSGSFGVRFAARSLQETAE
jgi:hypothetical protein